MPSLPTADGAAPVIGAVINVAAAIVSYRAWIGRPRSEFLENWPRPPMKMGVYDFHHLLLSPHRWMNSIGRATTQGTWDLIAYRLYLRCVYAHAASDGSVGDGCQ